MGTREFTGKSVQDAIKIGLEELGIGIDEADIDIVEEGNAGIFGIGAKKAVIRITPISEESLLEQKTANIEDDEPLEAESVEKEVPAVAEKEAVKEQTQEAPKQQDGGDSAEQIKCVTDFLDGLFERMGISCTYDVEQDGDHISININSSDSGKIIGHRGETLDAIQYVARLVLHRQDLPYRSLTIQTENYREKREQTLRSLANRLASKSERTGKRLSLEPMKPYERRIIHETLQNNPNVTTSSQGEEPNRYVIIEPKR